MERVIRIFHYISFIKYPIMLLGLYFIYNPIILEKSDSLTDMNTGLILTGLGISLDSLKDYGKLNWLDKKVLHKPKIAKYYFIFIGLCILSMILVGLRGYFSTVDNAVKELSIGIIVFGIGTVGFLKSGIQATKDYMSAENKTTGNKDVYKT